MLQFYYQSYKLNKLTQNSYQNAFEKFTFL
jgi:hypothetical protein